jgi:hypothetical protein
VKRRRTWILVIAALAVLVAGALALAAVRFPFSSEKLKQRVIATLGDRLDAEVELADLSFGVYPRLHATGTGLAIRHQGRRDVPPLISVKRFTVNASLVGLWNKRVSRVNLEGLEISIPPRNRDEHDGDEDERGSDNRSAATNGGPGNDTPVQEVVVEQLIADEAKLIILRRDTAKPSRVWAMHHLHVQSVGLHQKMPFQSILTNAVPPGEIDTSGTFGPWDVANPGGTPLDGRFTFRDADLSVFKGISGTLSAHGGFGGSLDTIDVKGETETPDFMVKVGGHPVPLKTKYHAIVDGTNGNTTLERIDATFLNSSLVAKGGVYDVKGVEGRVTTLDITMDEARIDDVMRLAVKTDMPPMTGILRLSTRFELPPGKQDVVDKLRLDGQFVIQDGRFTDRGVQQKIDELSRRALGNAGNKEPPPRVDSDFMGRFLLANGTLTLRRVAFNTPGAVVELSGQYGLESEAIAFQGNVYLDAKLSQTTTGWKSLLLKMVDPIFRKNGRTTIPVKVTGTRDKPSFGLDVKRVF